MAKRRTSRAEKRAEKKRAKLASYNQPKTDRKPSKCRLRELARRRGLPMSDRSGERRPWWDAGCGNSIPLSVQMAMDAARVRAREETEAKVA